MLIETLFIVLIDRWRTRNVSNGIVDCIQDVRQSRLARPIPSKIKRVVEISMIEGYPIPTLLAT